MNTYTIGFASSATALSSTLPEVKLYDLTSVTFVLSGISESEIPMYLRINWGDGESAIFENSFSKDYRVDSIIPEILYNKISSILSNEVSHLYYPSETSRYKLLSAEVNIEYINGDKCSIVQPFKIITSDYFESIGDMKHIYANIMQVSDNNKQFIFSVDKGGFLVEAESLNTTTPPPTPPIPASTTTPSPTTTPGPTSTTTPGPVTTTTTLPP
jgi:hypothetical protein